MTFESKDVIVEMLENDGMYPDDPQVDTIYEYTGINGKQLFAVFIDEASNDIYLSPYVLNPILLWSREGLTEEGKKFLEENQDEQT